MRKRSLLRSGGGLSCLGWEAVSSDKVFLGVDWLSGCGRNRDQARGRFSFRRRTPLLAGVQQQGSSSATPDQSPKSGRPLTNALRLRSCNLPGPGAQGLADS